jgi:hypothetical protein
LDRLFHKKVFFCTQLLYLRGLPPQGLSDYGGAGRFFFDFKSLICRGGVPSGAAAFIINDGTDATLSMIYASPEPGERDELSEKENSQNKNQMKIRSLFRRPHLHLHHWCPVLDHQVPE